MTQITFNPPKLSFSDDNDYVYDLLNQKRGPNRKFSHHLIIVETLRLVSGGKPTAIELQKLCKIRRKRFLLVLKLLMENESLKRSGTGTKYNPFVFELGSKELKR